MISFFLTCLLLRKNTTNFALIVKDFLFFFLFSFLLSFVDIEISFSSVCPHFALYALDLATDVELPQGTYLPYPEVYWVLRLASL